MLEVLQAQGEYLKNLDLQVKEMVSNRPADNYISNLEQQAATNIGGQNTGPVDWNQMDQQELVQNLSNHFSQQLKAYANQAGELIKLTSPQWPGWKMGDALTGLVGAGHTYTAAYNILKKEAEAAVQSTADNKTDGTASNDQQQTPASPEDFQAAVQKAAQDLILQQRQANAGVSGKPNRNDATAGNMTPRELNKHLHNEWSVKGRPIPQQFTRGL